MRQFSVRRLLAWSSVPVSTGIGVGVAFGLSACSSFSADDCHESRTCPVTSPDASTTDGGSATGGTGSGSGGSGGSSGAGGLGSGGGAQSMAGGAGGGAGAPSTAMPSPEDGGADADSGGDGARGADAEASGDSAVAVPEAGPLVCPDGFADCNGDRKDGCEVNLSSDPLHCGTCAAACNTAGTATVACTNGACSATCDAKHADCDKDLKTGCEVDTTTSVANCGGCGKACNATGATVACAAGVCVDSCTAGHADCDKSAANACEVTTTGDVNNCGGCGHKCGTANATPTCAASKCAFACTGDFRNCNAGAPAGDADGCETNLVNSPANCGACGQSCLGGACSNKICQPVTVSTDLNYPSALAVDGKNVYVSDTDSSGQNGRVRTFPLAGGVGNTIPSGPVSALATDGTRTYWSVLNTAASGSSESGYIEEYNNGTLQEFVGTIDPLSVAADANGVYWYDRTAGEILVKAHSPAGASPRTIAQIADVRSIVSDGTLIYGGSDSGQSLFCLHPSNGEVFFATTPPGLLQAAAVHVAVDASAVYSWYVDGNSRGHLYSLDKTTFAVIQEITSGSTLSAAYPFAVGGGYAYVVGTGGIYRESIKGGQSLDTDDPYFATSPQIQAMVLVGGVLYWIDSTSRLSKAAVF